MFRAIVFMATALFFLATQIPAADAQGMRRPPPKNTVLGKENGELPFKYLPGMPLTPEQQALLEQMEEKQMDEHSNMRPVYPFEVARWKFMGQTCSNYTFALSHGMHNEAGNFLKATWAYLAGKEGRKYIFNPLVRPTEETLSVAEKMYEACLQEGMDDKKLLEVMESDRAQYFPEIDTPPPASNATTAKWEMNRDVLDFGSVTCLNIAAQMMTNNPEPDFISHQDIIWAYLAGEWESPVLDLPATRVRGNHVVKYHCLLTENPETNLLGLMRDHEEELRDITMGVYEKKPR